ncbi:hypothetical protein PIIN_01666 [Serendipita indica DSM 11827]|uniref:Uncharacterized protein n=1 Tax=Serendipita indica (strain DSM 11827) TaxID=1109443 RepID=G4T949_SERID|nr:hypothetical protein PIIN_01666 [Serendipita indica DSM 11827]
MLETLGITDFHGEKHTLLPFIQERCFSPLLLPKDSEARISTLLIEVIGGRDVIESSLGDSDLFNSMKVEWEGGKLILTTRNGH